MKRKLIYVFTSLLLGYVLFASYHIYSAANSPPPNNADYIMILGAKVNGKELSLSLRERMITALRYLEDNPSTIAIVSGGQGDDEDISEAEAMSTFLVNNGIDSARIIQENESTSTYENFLYTKNLIDITDKKIVLVSNQFHLYRASLIARRQGYNVYPLGAETPNVVKLQSYGREYVAIIKTWIFDRE
ncbi:MULTISPECIES: YdcF family protein [Bacillaceae]|uniref:YdcF family protein n=1 Tax=Bacillaceae TaxID=186817 RepID=UPI00104CFA8C|nr:MULTISPECIES: YdcF family protein [Bacillaceae]MDT2046444.1 YdcF family protein [Priestia flexa]TDB49878.1 YdcF family protein [Bacillus sp. CBEL-1]